MIINDEACVSPDQVLSQPIFQSPDTAPRPGDDVRDDIQGARHWELEPTAISQAYWMQIHPEILNA